MTLTEFLTAQLDADETVARAADTGDRWQADALGVLGNERNGYSVADNVETEQAAHIVRHDPARVLREVEVKRAMIGLCRADAQDPGNTLRRSWATEILRALAAVYSDRPGYDEAWRV